MSIPPSLVRGVIFRIQVLVSRARCVWTEFSHAGVVIEKGVEIEAGVRFSITDGARLRIGSGTQIGRYSDITVRKGILDIGQNVFIGSNCTICAHSEIIIGDDCLIAERVTIRDQDHDIEGVGLIRTSGMRVSSILLGSGAWIGAGAILLRGASIGQGAVVGANALVKSLIQDFEVAVGSPAKTIRTRK